MQPFNCLDPVSDSVPANSSVLNATLTTVEDEATRDTLCAVWGEGFFARVSWAGDGSAADVFGVSNNGPNGSTVNVLGGVFLRPNDTTPMSILESQVLSVCISRYRGWWQGGMWARGWRVWGVRFSCLYVWGDVYQPPFSGFLRCVVEHPFFGFRTELG